MNNFDPAGLIRPHLLRLKPYSSARDEFSGQASVFLDANEHPTDTPFNRYPDPHQQDLKQHIARIKGGTPDRIFLGNGSDEPIDLLIRMVCIPGKDRILIPVPTYGMYRVSAAIHDTAVDTVPLNPDFSLPVERLLEEVTQDTKIIFLCSPNNPTGNLFDREAIHQVIRSFNGLVVVDEAYIDFSPSGSFLTEPGTRRNLVILQTFSKAWGLAGLRLGMCFADPFIIDILDRIKAPYNISSLVQSAVIEILKGKSSPSDADTIVAERNRLAGELQRLPFVVQVFPSEANFLLIRMDDPTACYRYLRDHGIITRDRSREPLCEGCLRITVGTPEQNRQLINLLHSFQTTTL